VAACPEGRRARSRVPDAVPVHQSVLKWSDKAGCQEKATYVLMVPAHRSYGDRVAMAETGATSTLVGTVLAQNRSSMIRVDKGKQATAHTFSPITSIIANY
jgi:predicted class III extradiol MEMO1 family dioxygenase